jgi:hypothetical protein
MPMYQPDHIGTVTDTDVRDIAVSVDHGAVRIDAAGSIFFLPIHVAEELRHLIGRAADVAAAHDPAGHVPDCTGEQPSGDCPACENPPATGLFACCEHCDDPCISPYDHESPCADGCNPEPGGATSAWEHRYA